MYWTLSSLPELQHLTDAERKQVIAQSLGWKTRTFLIAKCIAVGMLTAIVCAILLNLAMDATKTPVDIVNQVNLISLPICCLAGCIGSYQVWILRFRRQLRRYLQERREAGEDVPVCFKCGYAIAHGISQCPECGEAV